MTCAAQSLNSAKTGLVLLVALWLAAGAPPAGAEGAGSASRALESNDIELIVDGALRKRWTITDLMKGRFDWESPKKHIYPVVPVSFVIFDEQTGIAQSSVESVHLVGAKHRVVLEGDNLVMLDELLLKLDLDREGTWALVGNTRPSDTRLNQLTGDTRFKKVSRIEVSLRKAESPPAELN